jgi:hypothetical protein
MYIGVLLVPRKDKESQENKGLPDFESSMTTVLGAHNNNKMCASCQ